MAKSTDWDVVVLGGANTDYLVRGPRLPAPGETLEGVEFLEAPGGKGANQAVAAARLGARVAFVSRLGNDVRGEVLIRHLHSEGVDTQFVTRDDASPTGVALIMVDEAGQKQIFAAPGAIKRLDIECVRAAAPALQSTGAVLAQFEAPPVCVAETFRMARAAGAQTVLDPAPAVECAPELFALVDVIRPNAAEAAMLTGMPVRDRNTARAAAARLLQMGAGAAIVPSGGEGILVLSTNVEHYVPRLEVASVDATGAGDAFVAALAARLAAGEELVSAALFANAGAALSTTRFGAQSGLPRRDEVLTFLSQRR